MSAKTIYNKLMKVFGNSYGVCGLMGNLYAESGLKSTNLQNTYQTKLGMTDESYTEAVDNGSYTNFVRDSAGYGLAQWTYWSRKQNLLNFAKKQSKSIGNEDMQIDFLISELKGYKKVFSAIKNAKSVREASDVVLTQYERPANQSEAVKVKRAEYGQKYFNEFCSEKEETTMSKYSRQAVVDLVTSWHGKKESDGSFKEIIDIYNTLPTAQLPRKTKMLYSWEWCACTWSALAVKLCYLPVMPIEISCYYIIENAKKMGCWQENDNYVPKPADAVIYDWQDNGVGDNKGNPDHIGTVIEVYEDAGYMVVEEGNYGEAVKKRTISLNGKFIRGFITPKYTDNTVSAPKQEAGKSVDTIAREVISGKWGSCTARKTALTNAGYDYSTIQKRVNEILNGGAVKPTTPTNTSTSNKVTTKSVTATCSAKKYNETLAGTYKTTANLYMRNDAGTNKKALVCIPKGTKVKMYGYYNVANGVKWYYIQVTINGVKYTGFSSSAYLTRV